MTKSGAHTPAKSTPTLRASPARASNNYGDFAAIIQTVDPPRIAARVYGYTHEQADDMAALFVRAVNAFDPLVSALEQAVTLFEGDDECQTPGKDACMWLFDARAALSLAKDGTK
jgi:O-acetyl-ADP-ribose deacetylase (regulator of RNase III)